MKTMSRVYRPAETGTVDPKNMDKKYRQFYHLASLIYALRYWACQTLQMRWTGPYEGQIMRDLERITYVPFHRDVRKFGLRNSTC